MNEYVTRDDLRAFKQDILLDTAAQKRRIDALEARYGALQDGLSGINQKLAHMQGSSDAVHDSLEKLLDRQTQTLRLELAGVAGRIDRHDSAIARVRMYERMVLGLTGPVVAIAWEFVRWLLVAVGGLLVWGVIFVGMLIWGRLL